MHKSIQIRANSNKHSKTTYVISIYYIMRGQNNYIYTSKKS